MKLNYIPSIAALFMVLQSVAPLVSAGTCPTSNPSRSYWMYTLQLGSRSNMLSVSPGPKYMTTDYSYDGVTAIPAADVKSLKAIIPNPLSYLSIGEAENYRFYWKSSWTSNPPGYLGKENPSWQGNYKVKYWDPAWQQIIFGYLDKIVAAGWSGVYLDIIDGYEYWSDPANAKLEGVAPLTVTDAAVKMMNFVAAIAQRARKTNPAFLVFPQNAPEIIQYDKTGMFLGNVSGIGAEDVFFDGLDKATDTADRLLWLRKFKAAGKVVASVDYVDDGSGCSGANGMRIKQYLDAVAAEGFIGFPAKEDRALDTITCPCLGTQSSAAGRLRPRWLRQLW